jgi:hypothetical protein
MKNLIIVLASSCVLLLVGAGLIKLNRDGALVTNNKTPEDIAMEECMTEGSWHERLGEFLYGTPEVKEAACKYSLLQKFNK